MLVLMARYGNSTPLCKTQLVKRERPCLAEFAWMVDNVPECPVFGSCRRSKASPARISPRISLSGRCRRAAFRSKEIGFLKKLGEYNLNDFLCFSYIMNHTECHAHDQPIVAVENDGHGIMIASDQQTDQFGIRLLPQIVRSNCIHACTSSPRPNRGAANQVSMVKTLAQNFPDV
jgi:hypothetical protein